MSDKIKQKICHFDLTDIYQEQNWLEDMARKGLLLTYTGYLIYDFAYGEPTERRYRILPEKRKKIEPEELSIYESCGWKCIPGTHATTIFYTEDQNAPEPFTDVFTERKYYAKRLAIELIASILTSFIILMSIMLNMKGSIFHPVELYYQRADQPSPMIFIYLVVMPILALFYLVIISKYAIIVCRLKRGSYNRVKGFKARLYTNMIFTNVAILLMLGMFAYTVFAPDRHTTTSSFKEALAYKDAELVRFSEFDPATWDEVRANMTVKNDNKDVDNPAITYETSYDRNVMMIKMSSEDLEVYSRIDKDGVSEPKLMYQVQLYKAKSAKIAARFMPSNMEEELYYNDFAISNKRIQNMQFKYEGLDYAAYIVASEKDETPFYKQMLFLRKGSKYVVVTYSGPIDLKSKTGLFAAKM